VELIVVRSTYFNVEHLIFGTAIIFYWHKQSSTPAHCMSGVVLFAQGQIIVLNFLLHKNGFGVKNSLLKIETPLNHSYVF
jgi:hypothetical protein